MSFCKTATLSFLLTLIIVCLTFWIRLNYASLLSPFWLQVITYALYVYVLALGAFGSMILISIFKYIKEL